MAGTSDHDSVPPLDTEAVQVNGEDVTAMTSNDIAPLLSAIGNSYQALQRELEAAHVKIRQQEATIEVLKRRPTIAPAEHREAQGKLLQLEQDMASVIAKEKQELCLAILEAEGDMGVILSVFSTHIGGFGPIKVDDESEESPDWMEWKHVTDRWIPAICTMMQTYVDSPVVQREACRVLSHLCQQPDQPNALNGDTSQASVASAPLLYVNAERQNAVRENNGIPHVVQAMLTHGSDADLQSTACRTLRILCHKNATNRDLAGQCDAMKALVQALKQHVSVALVVSEGCTTLAAMCFENTKNKDTLRDEGGIPAMVECMTTCPDHVQNASVHSAACLALWKCCFENALNRDAIREAGGIPAIVFAMKQFLPPQDDTEKTESAANIEVQIQAMGALMNLSHQNNDNKAAARTAGAFEAVLSAMKAYPDQVLVQKHGCGALNNLLGDGRSVARGESVHKVKQSLLQLHPEDVLDQAGQNFPKECGALVRSLLKKLA